MLGGIERIEKPGGAQLAQIFCRIENDEILGFTTLAVAIRFQGPAIAG
jgi:hypothetical protein